MHRSDTRRQFGRLAGEAQKGLHGDQARLNAQRGKLIARHRAEREMMYLGQATRWAKEAAERSARLSKAFSGLWQRLTGARGKIMRQNESQALASLHSDRDQRQRLIDAQLVARGKIEDARTRLRREAIGLVQDLRSDRDRLVEKLDAPRPLPRRRPTAGHSSPDQYHLPELTLDP